MEKLHTLNTKIKNCTEKGSLNECLNEFVHVIDSAATCMFKSNKDCSKSEKSFSKQMIAHGSTMNVKKKGNTFSYG